MHKATTQTAKVLELARKSGILRVRDLTSRGIHPELLRRLVSRGLLTRISRGTYIAADADISAEFSLAQTAKRVPRGVICLLSALRFHNIGTQSPPDVWVAIPRSAAYPRVQNLMLRVLRFSGAAYSAGAETHKLNGVPVRITNPAKTVADCFKYRNKIGLDVAVEALRECLRSRLATPGEISQYARVNRVFNVMRPYLEAMI
ncbi:MAG: type IV toxin-antitoxin system AbiEi family antitoxin domain-containing protein [Candidatus Aureabacteria bacterium]|nr:type IV toxin-antitoxin system AbiEi family antitoxin domain-containing protein [Candidatus Auribacterota bacterium]